MHEFKPDISLPSNRNLDNFLGKSNNDHSVELKFYLNAHKKFSRRFAIIQIKMISQRRKLNRLTSARAYMKMSLCLKNGAAN